MTVVDDKWNESIQNVRIAASQESSVYQLNCILFHSETCCLVAKTGLKLNMQPG